MTGVYQPEMKFDDDDALTPSRIDHLVEEIYADGALEQKYNYLVYHFERNGAYIRARAYLDEIGVVSIYGPYESELVNSAPVEDAAFFALALAYLKRRYETVQKLAGDGYETVWRAGAAAQE